MSAPSESEHDAALQLDAPQQIAALTELGRKYVDGDEVPPA